MHTCSHLFVCLPKWYFRTNSACNTPPEHIIFIAYIYLVCIHTYISSTQQTCSLFDMPSLLSTVHTFHQEIRGRNNNTRQLWSSLTFKFIPNLSNLECKQNEYEFLNIPDFFFLVFILLLFLNQVGLRHKLATVQLL